MNPSKSIPEGVDTVTVEGSDLSRAVAAAAEKLEIDTRRVEFKLDLSHFRSSTGTSVAKGTVKIIAWNTTKSDEELEKAAPKKSAPKKERASRDDGEERKPRKPRRSRKSDDEQADDEGAAPKAEKAEDSSLEDTEASAFAKAWFTELMTMMDLEGEVKSAGNDERVQLWVSANKAGRLIGKRGSTLGSIRHLLGLAVTKKFGDLVIDVDVEDNRPRRDGDSRDGGDRKKERRGRDKRGGRDRDRKPRRDGGGDRNRYPEAKLRALARRAAEKVLESDKTITINLELNSYDRRIVHMEIADVDGVDSRSEERDDGVKIIQVFPEDA